MKAWVHYIPVESDLSDLKERVEWAENNQDKAQKISAAATALAKKIGTPEGFEELFHEIFEDPLRRVIDAYQPVTKGTWQEAMRKKKVKQSCKRNDRVRCFWSSDPLAKYAVEKCSAKDAKLPSSC